MLTSSDALQVILDTVQPLPGKRVPLTQALGCVLAEAIVAPITLPPFANSGMDGYALRASDTLTASSNQPVALPIVARVAAGTTQLASLPPQAAVRIMTGAPLPAGADTVLRLEDAQETNNCLMLTHPLEAGRDVRPAGEDVQAGDRVLEAGTVVTPARLAFLAGLGLAEVVVHRRPRVAILTTGNELVHPGNSLAPGQIYNSNHYAMWAMVTALGAEPIWAERLPDTPEATRDALHKALQADLILSSGGVSKGQLDYVGQTLHELGTVHFSEVAQQPGKPMTFATVQGRPVFALPGNPVATMVALEVYVRPALRKMMGLLPWLKPIQLVTVDEALPAPRGRQLFLRAVVREGHARLSGPQGSGLLSSMALANALLVIPADAACLAAGSTVTALPLDQEVPSLC